MQPYLKKKPTIMKAHFLKSDKPDYFINTANFAASM